MSLIRLDKLISNQTSLSRSQVRKLVTKGKVTVNGNIVRIFDTKVDDIYDCICVDGQKINYSKFVYFLLNKPKGILSASNDKSRKTVVDLIDSKYSSRNLFPVGRLDKDTTGLLIITDDGDIAHKIISPKSKIPKTYLVELDGNLSDSIVEKFIKGVVLADGTVCSPATLEIISDNTARVTITEGKYHQIKRMFGTVGLGVNNLHRLSIGNLVLPDNLRAGEYSEISLDFIKLFINV